MPALLSSTSSRSTNFFSRPSPYTVSNSLITFGRRSGYWRCSFQQSSTRTHMPPSIGLNTPSVMLPVGSLIVLSLVAQSYDCMMYSSLGNGLPLGHILNQSLLTMPPSSGSMISAWISCRPKFVPSYCRICFWKLGARFFILEYVDALVMVTSSPSRAIKSRITSFGFGVVEHISFVRWPSRIPN